MSTGKIVFIVACLAFVIAALVFAIISLIRFAKSTLNEDHPEKNEIRHFILGAECFVTLAVITAVFVFGLTIYELSI